MLLLIQELEEKENYEECALIFAAIKNTKEQLCIDLPTQYSKEAIKYFIEEINKIGFTGAIVLQNMPFYVEEIENFITQKITPIQ